MLISVNFLKGIDFFGLNIIFIQFFQTNIEITKEDMLISVNFLKGIDFFGVDMIFYNLFRQTLRSLRKKILRKYFNN